MKEPGQRNHLNEDKESLVIASVNIEGGHGPPLDCRGVAHNLQNIANAVNYRCGDNDILEKFSMRHFREVINRMNKNEDAHEDQKKGLVQG